MDNVWVALIIPQNFIIFGHVESFFLLVLLQTPDQDAIRMVTLINYNHHDFWIATESHIRDTLQTLVVFIALYIEFHTFESVLTIDGNCPDCVAVPIHCVFFIEFEIQSHLTLDILLAFFTCLERPKIVVLLFAILSTQQHAAFIFVHKI